MTTEESPRGHRPAGLGRIRALVIMAVLLGALSLSLCALLPPTPSNEEILRAITSSNGREAEPLDLAYEKMQVPHRYPGKAGAVLWVPDMSIQRNFRIAYDRKAKAFYVAGYETLKLGEDGSYRKVDP
jgi:hypothetical protein